MVVRQDIFSFINARYRRDSVWCVLVLAKRLGERAAHLCEMREWAKHNGEGHYTFLPDLSDIHWTAMQGFYNIPLDDWIKARQSHEMFLFTHVDTAFAFKLRFG